MRSEALKLRALPTARWTLAASLLALAIGLGIVAAVGIGGDPASTAELILGVPGAIASIVLGAWIIGLEYGQQTMRRALGADPRRTRLVRSKLGLLLVAVTGLTALLAAIGVPALSALADMDGTSLPTGEVIERAVGLGVANLIYATAAFGLALLTRSMAGGMALALGFTFIVDSVLAAIPAIGEYSLSSATVAIQRAITGQPFETFSESIPSAGLAFAVAAAWLGVIAALSITRFVRTDAE